MVCGSDAADGNRAGHIGKRLKAKGKRKIVTSSVESPPNHRVWSTLKEAVRGSHLDYTEAPIGRAVVLLAVPMVLEMLMESVFAVVDIFFVGRLGADAVATVGLTESLMFIVYALAIGLVDRRRPPPWRGGSARRIRNARRVAAVQAIILGGAVAVILGAIGALFGPQLIRDDGRRATRCWRTGSTFSRVMLGGCGTVRCCS